MMILIILLYLIAAEIKPSWITHFNFPFPTYELNYMVPTGFLFAIINPVLEELFWRIFIPKSFQIVKHHKLHLQKSKKMLNYDKLLK